MEIFNKDTSNPDNIELMDHAKRPLSSHAVLGEVAAIRKHCRHCVYYWNHDKTMIEPCSIHPYYNRNKNHDCKDFKKKWYLFWIRN